MSTAVNRQRKERVMRLISESEYIEQNDIRTAAIDILTDLYHLFGQHAMNNMLMVSQQHYAEEKD